jgi:uncharacterized repeat protein (TIGR01451 family)
MSGVRRKVKNMEQLRNIIIALVAVFLLLVCAAIGITFIVVNSAHHSTPTATLTVTPKPSATVPVYLPNVSYTPVPTGHSTVSPTPVPTSSGPAITSAEIADHGTDKQVYDRGDTATGFVVIRNTGNTVINNVNMNVSVSKYISFLGYVNVGRTSYPYRDEKIQPGDTRRIEFTTVIPKEYQGMSTAGDFEFSVDVTAEGRDVGSFTQIVKVQ